MIIISGASKGIGKYLFDNFKKHSSKKVIGTYNSSEPKNIEGYYKVDVADFTSVTDFYNKLETCKKEITLINCAGISYNSFAHKSEPEQWRKVVEVNLFGTYYMIRAFLPIMREENYGRIINLSSVIPQKGTPGVSAYSASKAALWGLSKSLCAENGSKNITINNINLGYVNLGMGVEQVPKEYQEIIKSQIPSKEFCNPQEILNTVEYLISTPYINGSSIDLSGGLV